MGIFHIILILATLLSSLVAGLLFAFAVVVMPGIRSLSDREYIRAFQEMDRIIQNNQPVFLLVWVGSVLALLASAVIGLGQLDSIGRSMLMFALIACILGVQLPTVAVNIPMNNRLQSIDTEALGDAACRQARTDFETRWNRWNMIRTIVASLITALLLILLFRI